MTDHGNYEFMIKTFEDLILIAEKNYATIERILNESKLKNEKNVIIILLNHKIKISKLKRTLWYYVFETLISSYFKKQNL